MNKSKVIIPAVFILIGAACQKEQTTTTEPIATTVDCNVVTYSETIKPLFDTYCLSCHGTNSPDGDLSTYNKTKVYADNGMLKKEVLTTRGMPIGSSFSSEQLGQVQCWLDAGAPNN